MSKIVALFSGQGAQYSGMGKDFYDKFEVAREVFDKADDALGFSISKLCFEGSAEDLSKTEITQPAILTTSISILRTMESLGFKYDAAAGLSLGEYGALVAAGAIRDEDAVILVNKRGRYMQNAVPLGVGGMAAVMGADRDILQSICDEASTKGIVEIANYNCPGQLVISGNIEALEYACSIAKEKGIKRAMMLPVSAPFHSSMLRPAGDKLLLDLQSFDIGECKIPVYKNVDGIVYSSKEEIVNGLVRQVSSPVLFEDSILNMIRDGYDTFVEIGPGKTLTSFVKKINKDVKIINVENLSSLETAMDELTI